MRPILLIFAFVILCGAAGKPGREIRIPLWTDGNGTDAALTVLDLTAQLEGSPARVVSVLSPATDLMVLLVTDVVGDISLVEPAKKALMAEIAKLPPNVHVGLMQAQDGLRVVLDPTTDREKVAAAIEALPVSGRPGLLDTVGTVVKIADGILNRSAIRVAVAYVTDSDVREYREDFTNPVVNSSDPHDMSRRFPEGLVREKISKIDGSLAAMQAPLFIVHLDYRSERLNEAYQAGLLQLAATTGGSSVFCRSSAEIPDAIRKMLRTIVSGYRVDVALPAKLPKMFQVQLESAGRTLSHRQRFVLDGR